MHTGFFVAIGSVTALGVVGFLFVWFSVPSARRRAARLEGPAEK
jgi:hypothetical protein